MEIIIRTLYSAAIPVGSTLGTPVLSREIELFSNAVSNDPWKLPKLFMTMYSKNKALEKADQMHAAQFEKPQ